MIHLAELEQDEAFKQVKRIAVDLVDRDYKRDEMFDYIDKMDELEYQLPESVLAIPEVHKMIATDPRDSLEDSTNLFAAFLPKPNIAPLGAGLKTDTFERALKWELNRAFRRRSRQWKKVIRDAFKYDMIAAQVVYLPNQISAMGAFSGQNGAEELDRLTRHHGDFAVVLRKPPQIHPMWNDLGGLGGVLHKSNMPVHRAKDFWGDYIEALMAIKPEDDLQNVSIFDFTTIDRRMVWGMWTGKTDNLSKPDGGALIFDAPNDLGFIPWVVRVGDEDNLQPLLYQLWKTKNWETQSIAETIMMTEVIRKAGTPESVVTGPSPEDAVTRDEKIMGGREYVMGDHVLDRPPKPQLDNNLPFIVDWIRQQTSKSTIPAIIQTANIPSGAAFASIEQAVSLGIKGLNDFKELAEEAFTEIYYQMIYWLDRENGEIVAYEKDEMTGEGIQFGVSAKDLGDIRDINLTVSLEPDLPEDQVQKINAALMLQQLGVSSHHAKGIAGIDDPDEDTKQRYEEEIKETIQVNKRRLMEAENERRVMEMMQPPEEPPPGSVPPGQGPPTVDNVPEQPALFNLDGQGMNPALGGDPAALGAPQTNAILSR